jgi:hypothetical protein
MSTEPSANSAGIPAAVPTDLQQAQTENGILKKDLARTMITLRELETDWARFKVDATGVGTFHDLLVYAVSAGTLELAHAGWTGVLLALLPPAAGRALRMLLGKSI